MRYVNRPSIIYNYTKGHIMEIQINTACCVKVELTLHCIAGLLGEFVIPSILIYFCAAYGLLIFANAWNITRVLCRTIVSALLLFSLLITFFCIFPFMLPFILPPVTVLVIFCYTLAGASHEGEIQPEKKSFIIKTVLTSLWLPCVVGTVLHLFVVFLDQHRLQKPPFSLCSPP